MRIRAPRVDTRRRLYFVFGALGLPGVAAAFLVPAWLTIVYLTARTSYFSAVNRREKSLREVADRLAGLAAELMDEQPRRLMP